MIGPQKIVSEFERYEAVIFSYIRDCIDNYFGHKCYTSLKRRMEALDASIDMKAGAQKNSWQSKISIPYGHEAYLMTRASLRKAFNADPICTLSPISATEWESAKKMQAVLNQNFRSTQLRDLTMTEVYKYTSRYGTCPVISHFEHRPEIVKATVNGRFGIERQLIQRNRQNVWNYAINPLNYFQNPEISSPIASDLMGWISRLNVSKLIGLVESMPWQYVKKNLIQTINEAKKSCIKSEHYRTNNAKQENFHGFTTDIEHIYCKLNFEGNEEDETLYYIEIAGDKIIRIQDNPHDYGITNISIFNLDKRTEYWWGNTPVEKAIPTENYANILMGATADNMLRASQSMIFYPKGKIDTAAINDRFKNGGFIPTDPELFYAGRTPFMPFQKQEVSTASVQYMMAEMKEILQRTQAKPDVSRSGVQGGLQNDTATAYQGMAAQSDALQFDYLSEFAAGIKQLGRVNTIMLQEGLDDIIGVRTNPKQPIEEMRKEHILGEFDYEPHTSLTKNSMYDLMKFQNALTWVMNMKGTGAPELQSVNVEELFRGAIRAFDLDVDIEKVYPEQQPQAMSPQAMQIPSAGIPAAEPMPVPSASTNTNNVMGV